MHITAVVQLRNNTEDRAYYRRKLATGKTPMEAKRALKRKLSDLTYRQIVNDAKNVETDPAGHAGTTLQSSTADPIPIIDTTDKPLPRPAKSQPRTPLLAAS